VRKEFVDVNINAYILRDFFSCVLEKQLGIWSINTAEENSNNRILYIYDRLCNLVVRGLGYRSEGPGSIPGTTRKTKVAGLERGPPGLVSTTEELLDRKVAAPV
jgi:hypothetical protein